MDLRPGIRVRARGLTWDVLEVDGTADHRRLGLRCVDGDMAGLEWQLHVPPDPIELVDEALDPRAPARLSQWHLMHRARRLNEVPGDKAFLARVPGRVRVEPYQMVPLMRALDMPRPRLLLADGVGLGKTVQAGLIAVELIARRRARRILIVAPSGPLLLQWEQETRLRFGLKFTVVSGAAELWEVRRAHELGANPFDAVSLCITALDFAKQDHILEELERSTWDLVIIDEAHHCVGSTSPMSQENTYRRRLAEVLARQSDGMLLLTATPHDGHDEHFASLIALLDPSLVDGAGGFVGREYRRHVIRRMKVHIRDPRTGAPLFRPRHVTHVKVDVGGPEHETVRDFHRALSAFVVPRLRRRPAADDALAFVSLLKRSVSTISACLETLRVVIDRIARNEVGETESRAAQRDRARALRAWRRNAVRFGGLSAMDQANQEVLEAESMAESLRGEPNSEPARLIRLGVAAEAHDPKLSAIILEVRLIRSREPKANILIYTEYTDSQLAAARALRSEHGIASEVLTIGGHDDERARAAAARRFADRDGQILISTDSLAEGLNLHNYCHHLIHLDLPFNPNRLEQRNGRIDRYGQRYDPDIRYLYIPGTFEESLLLHLIAKYEKARSSLDVMPETLGMTASPDDYAASLMGGVSDEPGDLFKADAALVRTLDRAVGESQPETVAALMRDIDRAFDAFDLMAVSHGWHGARGLNAGIDRINDAEQRWSASDCVEDLPDFVSAVIEAETNERSSILGEISLPKNWVHGLDGLPGLDPPSGVFHFTRSLEVLGDAAGRGTGFLGRAHPLVLRAMRHGCRIPGAVAVARGDHIGLLLTYEVEIPVGSRIAFREMIGVMVRPDTPPTECRAWPDLGQPHNSVRDEQVWDHQFESWGNQARADGDALLRHLASERHASFIQRFDALRRAENDRARHWLRVKADQVCGAFIPPTGDLFGEPTPGPVWLLQEDPTARLISFATCLDTPLAKRREADKALETFQAIAPHDAMPGPIASRPIGMLMLVPRIAI